MKKLLLFAFILVCTTSIYSQNFSYGFVTGVNYHDTEAKNSSRSITGEVHDRPNIHVGAFADYQFSERLGVKLNTQYNRLHEKYRLYLGGTNYINSTYSINTFQIIPHLKFDVKTAYNKGGYLLVGPRMSIVVSANDDSGTDVKDFYKSTNFGVQAGFGFNLSKIFALELLGEYGFSDITESEPTKITTAGIYINFNVNVEAIINR